MRSGETPQPGWRSLVNEGALVGYRVFASALMLGLFTQTCRMAQYRWPNSLILWDFEIRQLHSKLAVARRYVRRKVNSGGSANLS
jgi:hypothetical protein